MTPLKKEEWQEVLVNLLGRLGITLLILFILLVLSAFPFQLGSLGVIRPVFILIAVYYWTITRPEFPPPIAVFVTGLLFDLVAGYPFGMMALTLVAVQWIIRLQRRFLAGQPFRVIWAGMALVAAGTGLVQWLLFSIFYGMIVPILPVLMSLLVTTAVFPLFVPLLARLNKVLAERDQPG